MSVIPQPERPVQSICILGRQPALGLAELESLFGADTVQPLGNQAALLDLDPAAVNFGRLGGSLRLAKVLAKLDTTDWNKIEQQLRKTLPQHLAALPEGKLKLGLSCYGFSPRELAPAKLNAAALSLKKTIKNTGRSVRAVPNTQLELNTAQVIHNGLTTSTGCELLIIRVPGSSDGQPAPATWIAQTVRVQDIEAYAARDQGRPKRDARVGMLPPKLAQIIVNLAADSQPPSVDLTILDPFCGTGVMLQEAALMGFKTYGSDLEPRMVDYTDKNLVWLSERHDFPAPVLETGDATSHTWEPKPDLVACESYLGRPFTTAPDAETLSRTISDCNQIIKKFLHNIFPQLPDNARLCIAVPSWQVRPEQFKQLPLIDHLTELGYNRVSFEHVEDDDLRYYRADQIVARQLLILTKQP